MPQLLLPSNASGSTTSAVAAAAAPLTRSVEPVGRAYQATKHAPPKPSSGEEDVEEAKVGVQLRDPKYDRYKKFDIELTDYYTLLGLDDKMFDATKDEITEAYRVLCKVIHPDKALPEDREKAEARYKALQVGWETLTDAARRKGYDSSLPFDNALPKDKEGSTEKTFYSVYGPVFDRNSRWSTIRPVPRLGDANSADEDVLAFYDFWNAFSSWREFPELNENTLESASCREQKRQYQRENEKKQAGAKKDELARIRKLTEAAYKKDPRVTRIRSKQDEAKNAAKKKKEQEAAEKEAAAKKAAEDAVLRAKEEEERKKREADEKKNYKEVLKKTRNAFGKTCKAAGLSDEKTDVLRAILELEQLQEINDAFAKDAKSAHGIELFNAYINKYEEDEKAKKAMSSEQLAAAKLAEKKLEEARAAAESQAWSHDEEAILVRAMNKYPPGTVLRWETITDMVNSITSRNMKDVIRKAKLMETSQLGHQHIDDKQAYELYQQKLHAKTGTTDAASTSSPSTSSSSSDHVVFSVDEQAAFESALKTVSKDAADRWDQIAAIVKTKTKQQCVQRYKEIREDIKKHQTK